MDAAFTAEQHEIRHTLRELLRKRCGPDDVRAAVRTDAGHDEALWRALAEQLGLPGLALPAEYGGAGFGPTELVLACEETGRVLLPSPLLGTALLAAPLIAALGTPGQKDRLLPPIASGQLTAAYVPPSGGERTGGVQADASGVLYGQADRVLGGHSADLLLIAAHTGGYVRPGLRIFLVPGDAPGLTRTRLTALDETRPQARVQLRHVPAEPLGDAQDPAATAAALARAGALASAALAAEAVGAADRVLTATVEYVRIRKQFGRPVGSFQAVKHRLADVHVRLQAARSAAYYAAWAVGDPGRQDPAAPPLALAEALGAQRTAAAEGIQLHGGVGFTWEHQAHLYFKRAACDELLFGPVHRLRAEAARKEGVLAC